MPGTQFTFKGNPKIGQELLCSQLEYGLQSWSEWAMLYAGAFINVTLQTSGAYGGNFSTLRLSEDPNYELGQVWEGARSDWVWESGTEYTVEPIQISGVYIDGTFYPVSTAGTYAHKINYPMGRIVFNSAIDTDSEVKCEHAFRYWQISTSNVPWYRELQYNSMRPDDPQFADYGSGAWSVMAKHRVQMPHVVIDAVPNRSHKGLEIGGGVKFYQDIDFHIYTENPHDMKWGADVFTYQWNKTAPLVDRNLLFDNNAFPLDSNGSIADGALTYPDLQTRYPWSDAQFERTNWQSNRSEPPLYYSIVRATVIVQVLI